MNFFPVASRGGAFDSCWTYYLVAPYLIVAVGYGAFDFLGRCVGITSMLFWCIQASRGIPVAIGSPIPALFQCSAVQTNHKLFCSAVLAPSIGVGSSLFQHILPQSCPQPMWTRSASCRASIARVPVCFDGTRVCWGVFLVVHWRLVPLVECHTCLWWPWCRQNHLVWPCL